MKSVQKIDLGLTGYDELFMNDAERKENKLPRIYDIPLSEIDDFPDHPFNKAVDFSFRNVSYHVEIVGVDVFPQGFAAVADRLSDFRGVNMICDIGNGTMNIMFINDKKPVSGNMFTEKYGTHQCLLAVRENVIPDGALPAYKKKCVPVVQHTHFVRCHQLSSGKLIVGGIASVSAARPSVGIRIDGLLAQQLGNILVGTLLVAAQVQKFIAVAHNTFPLLLEQSFQLRKVLDDDGDGNLTASHGGQELIKLIRQGDIGKLVHDEMHMHGQPATVNGVGLIVELLKQLGIKHTHDEIEGTVVIGNNGEYRRFLFADLPQIHFIALGNAGQRIQIELFQTGDNPP